MRAVNPLPLKVRYAAFQGVYVELDTRVWAPFVAEYARLGIGVERLEMVLYWLNEDFRIRDAVRAWWYRDTSARIPVQVARDHDQLEYAYIVLPTMLTGSGGYTVAGYTLEGLDAVNIPIRLLKSQFAYAETAVVSGVRRQVASLAKLKLTSYAKISDPWDETMGKQTWVEIARSICADKLALADAAHPVVY